MTGLMMRVQRSGLYGSIDEAREPIAALARELGAANALGRMWTLFRGVILPLDLETIELLLSRGRWLRAGRPGQPTHVIPLNIVPACPGEIGQISLMMVPENLLPPVPENLLLLGRSAEHDGSRSHGTAEPAHRGDAAPDSAT